MIMKAKIILVNQIRSLQAGDLWKLLIMHEQSEDAKFLLQ